ncbi:helix-turn-helix domain-containing protein [Clostridium sp. BJN0013]|uniref:helix-turn-helix domain-containing protein n=1 Tax=Clostridium sp. BJN0013 TaxID=3236840 RepID=UPI0034C5B504
MNIGKKIKSLRLLNNYSTTKLSKEAGIAQSYLSDIESGKSNPTIEKLSKILDVFNISLAEFFTEDENIVLPREFKELLKDIKNLSPEQIQLLSQLVKNMK